MLTITADHVHEAIEANASVTEQLDRMHFARMVSQYGEDRLLAWWIAEVRQQARDAELSLSPGTRTDPRR